MINGGKIYPDWDKLPRWREVEFPTHNTDSGSLSIMDSPDAFRIGHAEDELPWAPRRVYWLHSIVDGGERGAHATFESESIIIPIVGGFRISLDDGVHQQDLTLIAGDREMPAQGVHLYSGVWRDLTAFQYGTVVLCVSSTSYEETDYVRDKDEWVRRVEIEKNSWLLATSRIGFEVEK